VLDRAETGDRFLFYPSGSRKPFAYYARRRGEADLARFDESLSTGASRVWFVVRDSDAAASPIEVAEKTRVLTAEHRFAERRQFRRVTIDLYER
jgi:hypothetical protein